MSLIEKYSQGVSRVGNLLDAQADLPMLFPFSSQLPFYGKVTSRMNPVQPNEIFLKPVVSDATGGPIVVMDFVADAFQDLRNYILRANYYDKIPKNTNFSARLIDIKPTEGYSDLDNSYLNYMGEIYRAFYEVYILANNKEYNITNFTNFMKEFMEFATMVADQTPITKSGYYLNGKTPMLHTGLVLKIHDTGAKTPETRKELLSDPAYKFFATSAKKFGFLINADDPTMLVANLYSGGQISVPPRSDQPGTAPLNVTIGMKRYLDKYFLDPGEVINERYYSIVYDEEYFPFTDFNLLKTYLLQFYNDIYDKSPSLTKSKTCLTPTGLQTTSHIVEREFMERGTTGGFPARFQEKYPDEYWLNIYLRLKQAESKKKINIGKAYRNAFVLYRENGLKVALAYVNKITKVTPYVVDRSYLASLRDIPIVEMPQESLVTQISSEEAQAITSALDGPIGGSTGGGMSGY